LRTCQPKLEPMDVGQLVASTTTFARNDPLFRNISFDVTGVGPAILGDADLLRTVLLNLLTNSAQAWKGWAGSTFSVGATEESCQIVVTDRGPGVPADARDRLFTPFFTTKNAWQRARPGDGEAHRRSTWRGTARGVSSRRRDQSGRRASRADDCGRLRVSD
jgi:signal transduction histidine kinase